MSDRMSKEEMQAFGVIVADLVDAKVSEKVDAAMGEMRAMLATAGDAGHAAVTRAGQVEDRVDQHELRIRRLERANNLPPFEDDFPRRETGT